jgi:two-component system sensor histidine kinase UhpB
LRVQDDGVGLAAAGISEARPGLGLSTMRERAEITGGRFALRAGKGGGTTVAVSWPTYNEAARS